MDQPSESIQQALSGRKLSLAWDLAALIIFSSQYPGKIWRCLSQNPDKIWRCLSQDPGKIWRCLSQDPGKIWRCLRL